MLTLNGWLMPLSLSVTVHTTVTDRGFFFFNLGLFRKGFVCDEFSKETANMATPQSGRVFIVNKREYPEACERIQSREREADWT